MRGVGGSGETAKAFPLRGSLFAVPAGFMVLPRALPLGELDAKRPERARPQTFLPGVFGLSALPHEISSHGGENTGKD